MTDLIRNSNLMDKYCESAFWDFNITQDQLPNFTSCFRNTILVWTPCFFLWIFSPLELYYMLRSTPHHKRISFNFISWLKMVLIILTASINMIEVVIAYSDHLQEMYLHSALLKFVTFILYFILTWANLKKGIQSPTILFCFSLIAVICGLPQIIHFVIAASKNPVMEVDPILYSMYFSGIALILLLNCVSDSRSHYSNICPAHEASFISKIFVLWFNRYISQNNEEPVEENLWDLDHKDSAIYLTNLWKKPIQNFLDQNRPSADNSLEENQVSIKKLLLSVYGFDYTIIFVWKIANEIVIFLYPLLLGIIISCLKEEKPSWMLYMCAFCFILINTLENITNVKLYTKLARMSVRVHSILMSIIYKKILHITDRAKNIYASGEMVALISTDVANISETIEYSIYFLILPFEIGFTTYYIWEMFGPGTIVTLLILIFSLPLCKYFSYKLTTLSSDEMKHRNKRGKFLQDLLAGIHVLKMYAWESSFLKKASNLRHKEYKNFEKIGNHYTKMLFTFNSLPLLMSFTTFAVHLYLDIESIGLAQAFVAITLYSNFKSEFICISKYLNFIIQGYLSAKKIDEFLRLPELDDEIVSHDVTDEALTIEDGTFSWTSPNDAPVLKNLNLNINKGALVTIIGSVGSGKSSLISAFLGELFKIGGYVNVNGKIAYVSQQAWILNTTVKENITMGEKTSDSTYNIALKSCALNEDLKHFPAGDKTEIGEKGINLSGGQKQRINLARAICCEADIYLFDDALSAVDTQVSKHIFDKVLGPSGFLKDKTRILVTHNTSFSSQCDLIILLQDGCVTGVGTFQEMMSAIKSVSEYLKNDSQVPSKFQNESQNETEHSSRVDSCNTSTNLDKDDTNPSTNEKSAPSDATKLITKEHVQKGKVANEVYKFLIKNMGLGVLIKVIGLNILYQVISIFSRIWLMLWATANETNNQSRNQAFYLSIYAILGIFEVISYATNHVLIIGIFKTSAIIYDKLIEAVLQWPQWLINSTTVGSIINRATTDSYTLDGVLSRIMIEIFEYFNKYFFAILLITYVLPISAIFIINATVMVLFVKEKYKSLAFQLQRINANNKSPLYSFMVETLQGLHSIRANGYQNKFISQSYPKIDLYSSATIPITICQRWLAIRTNLIISTTVCIILSCIFYNKENLEVGLITLTISYIFEACFYCEWIFIYYTYFENGIISVERMKEFIDFPKEKYISEYSTKKPKEWPSHGEIKFIDYKLRYKKQDELVLKGLTFSVESGEKIGIVGRTGAGKSSMITAMLRMMEPDSGTILLDNVDITQIDLKVLRSRLTLIPQDPVLFLGTLRFNLDPKGIYDDEDLWSALEKAHLKDYVKQSALGLDYHIEEGGANISCGQRQLLCLARALLRKTKVILLDEATASVDLETDELIQNTIRNEFADCTVLTIAHRLNTIQDYDRILVLDGGRIIEYDTPSYLVSLKDSTFYNIMLESCLISA